MDSSQTHAQQAKEAHPITTAGVGVRVILDPYILAYFVPSDFASGRVGLLGYTTFREKITPYSWQISWCFVKTFSVFPKGWVTWMLDFFSKMVLEIRLIFLHVFCESMPIQSDNLFTRLFFLYKIIWGRDKSSQNFAVDFSGNVG